MSYIRCCACNEWSQDDFYCKSYNMWTKIWDDIKWLIKPRIIDLDNDIVYDLIKYTKVPIFFFPPTKGNLQRFFSWNWLLLEIVKDIKVARKMHWKTREQWINDPNKHICPHCGAKNSIIED